MNLGSDEASTTASEKAESGASAAQTPGALLEQERTRRGLSVQEAADGLHLDSWIIEAIEANRFAALGAPVYAKGYLRKYAMLLGLAPDVVIARYDALTDTLPVPTPVPVITTTPPPRPRWPKYVGWSLLAFVVIGIAFAAYTFLWPVEAPTPSSVQSTVTLPPEPTAPEAVAPPPTAVVQSPEPEPAPAQEAEEPRATPVATQQPEAATTPATNAAAGAGSVQMTLTFDAPSWVEIYDAGGDRLMYDIGQAGRVHAVEGQAPLNVVIGVAAAVKVRVNDRDVIVPRRANRDSARFVVNADGSVR